MFRVFILFLVCALRVCAPVCGHVLYVCTVLCRCAVAYVCRGCGELVVGHGLGAWGPRWAGGRRWELPVGSLL